MKCPSCGAVLGCGCQRRIASDGTPCCSKCVTTVNTRLAQKAKNLNQNPLIKK